MGLLEQLATVVKNHSIHDLLPGGASGISDHVVATDSGSSEGSHCCLVYSRNVCVADTPNIHGWSSSAFDKLHQAGSPTTYNQVSPLLS